MSDRSEEQNCQPGQERVRGAPSESEVDPEVLQSTESLIDEMLDFIDTKKTMEEEQTDTSSGSRTARRRARQPTRLEDFIFDFGVSPDATQREREQMGQYLRGKRCRKQFSPWTARDSERFVLSPLNDPVWSSNSTFNREKDQHDQERRKQRTKDQATMCVDLPIANGPLGLLSPTTANQTATTREATNSGAGGNLNNNNSGNNSGSNANANDGNRSQADFDLGARQAEARDRRHDAYLQEVQRAIYGNPMEHQFNDPAEYHRAAEEYAVYGRDFFDFPDRVVKLANEKTGAPLLNVGSQGVATSLNSSSTVNYSLPSKPELPKPSFNVAPGTPLYYHSNGGPSKRASGGGGNGSTGNSTGGSAGGGVVASPSPSASSLAYNEMNQSRSNTPTSTSQAGAGAAFSPQHQSVMHPNAPVFIPNSLANAGLASSHGLVYANPMMSPAANPFMNAFMKEPQSPGVAAAAVAVANTSSIYERLVYAQMLQQQIYQQQAAAIAALLQQKQRPPRVFQPTSATATSAAYPNNSLANNTNNTNNTNNNNNNQLNPMNPCNYNNFPNYNNIRFGGGVEDLTVATVPGGTGGPYGNGTNGTNGANEHNE